MIKSFNLTIEGVISMKKTTYVLLAMTVLTVLFASACGSSNAPAAQAAPVDAAANQAAPAVNAQTFAPACQTTTSCAPANVDLPPYDTYCVIKATYQNLLLDPGVTFELVNPADDLNCYDSGTDVKGKNVITCTGKQLWTYELKLTNTACTGGSSLQAGTGQCQEGLGFDAAQNCCAPITNDGGNSTIIKVNIGACPGPHP